MRSSHKPGAAFAVLGTLCLASAIVSAPAAAAEPVPAPWWPAKVIDAAKADKPVVDYVPLDKASKPWSVCVLFPHMKDSFWVAVAYGIVSEAQRQNIGMTLYEAGGYSNLPRQLSQFDDCRAAGADAVIVGAISEAGLAQKIAEARAAGVAVVGAVNPMAEAATNGKIFVDFPTMSAQTGRYLVDHLGAEGGKVVTFPGPAGSGWAEAYNDGFKQAVAGSAVTVLDEKFGDTGVAVQQQLVQDALQAYPDMTVVWGTAPTAEAAIGAAMEAGRDDVLIMSTYENQAMLDAMKRDEIAGFATQYPVLQGRIAVDMAVRALEGAEVMAFAQPVPEVVTRKTADAINLDLVLAPADWRPSYTVSAR
ncbi:TMAO reductase system periplasmic protein TorT [Caenispirillum bisanense]|uniref:Monosaccharide ABC transporter substrate-binding protein, CUT2 family n=1 Tax=Caenispirillum bisanense TaxID=414052 RepID=A0A286GL46_9PROT|nr:TMAO reductase system periplasmic protein TorT [Caenispirillum bisanense]SOD96248.1 monosaccharide ABC transporter substrate-binding protein, CUT2 family [Caenispirillum bisanense]